MSKSRIVPVILAGGSGTRLWPLSREAKPKQFHALHDRNLSLFQQTVLRVQDREQFASPIVVSNQAHRFVANAQLQDIGVQPAIHVLEPSGRSTGPAITAAVLAAKLDPKDLVLALPTDHFIGGLDRFSADVADAANAAEQGHIVLFGLAPDRPETGYGYVRFGHAIPGAAPVRQVIEFVEKPTASAAKDLLENGGCLWNLGMFLFRKDTLTEELSTHAPEMLAAVSASIVHGGMKNDHFWLEPNAFNSAPARSIDYALIEKTRRSAVMPSTFGWSDLGSWREIWGSNLATLEDQTPAADQLVTIGDVVAIDSRRSYLRSDSGLVAAIGVEDLMVVSSGDAVLVAPMSRSQEIGRIAEQLQRKRRREASNHLRTYRPWGNYLTLAEGPGFQVKILTLNPGAAISFQYHEHRSERWIVVEGEAEVVTDGKRRTLRTHESIEIAKRVKHQLINPGLSGLKVIEVQAGDYLGEDDIVRLSE